MWNIFRTPGTFITLSRCSSVTRCCYLPFLVYFTSWQDYVTSHFTSNIHACHDLSWTRHRPPSVSKYPAWCTPTSEEGMLTLYWYWASLAFRNIKMLNIMKTLGYFLFYEFFNLCLNSYIISERDAKGFVMTE